MHRLIGIARLKVIGQQLEERRASRVQEVPRSGERGGAIPDVREACGREIGVVQERVRRNGPPVDRDQIALSIEEKGQRNVFWRFMASAWEARFFNSV